MALKKSPRNVSLAVPHPSPHLPPKDVTLLITILSMGDRGTERFSDLPDVPELVCNRAGEKSKVA